MNLNGVEILLRMFYDWHRTDHHNRQTAIRKALLNSLKALVSTSKLVSASSVQARVRTKLESPGVSLNLKTKKVQYIKRPAYADFRERMYGAARSCNQLQSRHKIFSSCKLHTLFQFLNYLYK